MGSRKLLPISMTPINSGMAYTTRTTSPTFSSLTDDEVYEWLRLDADTDTNTVPILVDAATEVVEGEIGQVIRKATYTVEFQPNEFRFGILPLDLWPVQSITSVTYVDANGDTQTVTDTKLTKVRTSATVEAVIPYDAQSATVTCVAGYADLSSIPESIRWAIAVLVSAGYDNRQAFDPATLSTVKNLVARHRRVVL